MITATRRVLAAALVVLALVATGCGSDGSTEAAGDATTTTLESASTENGDETVTTEPTSTTTSPDEVASGIDLIQELAAAMRDYDWDYLAESNDPWFIEWQTALRAEPEFTDCAQTGTRVSCNVVFGDDFFYTQISGETKETTIGGTIRDGRFFGSSFPPWGGLFDDEAELRAWVQENRPELENELYGTPSFLSSIKMTRESGELRMELLDEFLAATR